jgi:hypothetical protein
MKKSTPYISIYRQCSGALEKINRRTNFAKSIRNEKKTVACPARLPQACSVLLAPDTTETATNRCKSPKQNEKKRWARGGTVTHPIQSHTHTRELAYPTAANRRQKETKQPTQGGKRGAARDERPWERRRLTASSGSMSHSRSAA